MAFPAPDAQLLDPRLAPTEPRELHRRAQLRLGEWLRRAPGRLK